MILTRRLGLTLLAALALDSALDPGLAADASRQPPLADPTRPPNVVLAPDEGGEQSLSEPRLQSVLISPNRRIAVISGETVAQGGAFRDAKVVRIAESEVVLSRGADMQVLKLVPGVDKKARRSPAAGGAREGRK